MTLSLLDLNVKVNIIVGSKYAKKSYNLIKGMTKNIRGYLSKIIKFLYIFYHI